MPGIPDPRAHPLVLVADDRPSVRAVFRSGLEAAGYGVVEARDGREAVAQAARNDLSVILLDVAVPGLDGHQTLAALKADAVTRDVPVVFLSDRGAGDDLVQALHEGAHDYLRTPPEPAELLARVGAATRVKQLQDELRTRAIELEHVSRTDHLTGLANRRHVEEQLRAVVSAALRHAHPAAVLVIDVDHFKSINDQRGHAAGDQVLQQIATTLQASVRTEDILGRWGGEEFIVIVPGLSDEEALRAAAEGVRRAIRQGPFALGDELVVVTVSVGAAHAADGEGPDDLVSAADRALYAAKRRGRGGR